MEMLAANSGIILFLVLGFGIFMAWGIGANDVANAMGTSVGSGALTLKQAIIIAAVFEFLGAFLAGGEVTSTIRKGIIDPALFEAIPDKFVLGMLSALLAAATWLLVASNRGWPVSTTHSIVGAIVGFSAVVVSVDAVNWGKVGEISASWEVSPLLADGVIKIEMHFLPDVYVECETCKGARYNRETLEVKFKGKSIADVLDMNVEEAQEFFKAVPSIREKMDALMRVGLGYIKVGQQATTLSGGEAQRVKLSKELAKRSTGRTLYILDEPTTGLHFEDVRKLLEVLQELVEGGNTVIVIEHNLDVVKTADWIIDIGPEGGDGGGEIVAVGTPEDVAREPRSHTGHYLKDMLNPKRTAAE